MFSHKQDLKGCWGGGFGDANISLCILDDWHTIAAISKEERWDDLECEGRGAQFVVPKSASTQLRIGYGTLLHHFIFITLLVKFIIRFPFSRHLLNSTVLKSTTQYKRDPVLVVVAFLSHLIWLDNNSYIPSEFP